MISVVIPLHNEEANVPLLAQKLTAAMESLGRNYEVIFINDGSTDAMEAARNFIGTAFFVKFSAGMKFGHDNFHRRHSCCVHTNRNPAAVVFNCDTVI
jgi:glycosyltransferase involved in cell wall biosynthesis